MLPPAASAAGGLIRPKSSVGPGSAAGEIRRSFAAGTFPLDSSGVWSWCFVPNCLA